MNPFNKLFLIVALVLAVGVGVAVAAGTNGGSTTDPASTVVDVKGPCDEAEHANDPECAGAQVPEDDDADEQGEDANDDRGRGRDHAEDDAVDDDDDQGEDISGPCDEAEHANDPRCTGVGGDDQGEDADEQGEDNSGPSANSGPGSSHDDRDGGNSGPGGGDDD